MVRECFLAKMTFFSQEDPLDRFDTIDAFDTLDTLNMFDKLKILEERQAACASFVLAKARNLYNRCLSTPFP